MDLEVVVHFDDDVHEQPPRSVKWADLEDTDAEDEDCTGTTAGLKGILGRATESQLVPRASSAASVETGRADVRLGNGSQVLGRCEGLASANPSQVLSSAECLGGPGDRASRKDSSAPSLRVSRGLSGYDSRQ